MNAVRTKTDVCSDDDDVDFDEIIELLKASSETHSEDDKIWENFKIEIEKRRQDFVSGETARKVRVCGNCILTVSIIFHTYHINTCLHTTGTRSNGNTK